MIRFLNPPIGNCLPTNHMTTERLVLTEFMNLLKMLKPLLAFIKSDINAKQVTNMSSEEDYHRFGRILDLVVDRFMDEYSLSKPEEINYGFCYDFASDIAAGEDIEQWETEFGEPANHCFIKYKQKWFDAQDTFGVDEPSELPFFKKFFKKYPKEQLRIKDIFDDSHTAILKAQNVVERSE